MLAPKQHRNSGHKPIQQKQKKKPFKLKREGLNATPEVQENHVLGSSMGNIKSESSSALHSVSKSPPKNQENFNNNVPEEDVKDYNRIGSHEKQISTEEYEGRSYYEGLVQGHFNVSFSTENKTEQATLYQEIWDHSPKRNNIPFVLQDTEEIVGVQLSSGAIEYYRVIYKRQKNVTSADGKYYMDVEKIASSAETPYLTNDTHSYPPQDRMKEQMLGRDYGGSKYDYTFPAVDGQEEDRMGTFFEDPTNKEARSAYYGYMNEVYTKEYYKNKSIEKRIEKLEEKPDKAKYDGELQELKQNVSDGFEYPFRSIVNGGAYSFLVYGRFKRARPASEIGLVQLEVICLSGPNAGIAPKEASTTEKSFTQGKIEAYYQKHSSSVERPNIIIEGSIPTEAEQYAVEEYIFDNAIANNFQNRFRDTHFDQELIIDGKKVIYSFTISAPQTQQKDSEVINYIPVPENHKRVDVYIERQGEVGTENGQLSDPDLLRIKDVFGYSDTFNKEQFIDFVHNRYSAIDREEIDGDSKAETIANVNEILNKKAETAAWYSENENYAIEILNSTSDIKNVLVDDLDFFVSGEHDSDREQARVRGKSEGTPGEEVPDTYTGEDVQTIQDETEGIKPWKPEELKLLEVSLQKFSTALLSSLKGMRYFRQDYNKLKGTYNIVGGLTFQGRKTIGIYDNALKSTSRVVGDGSEFTPAEAWTITHETGHVIQHDNENGEAFNEFYKMIDQDGPTDYSRSFEISDPDSEFFPEAITLYFHDPEFLAQNFPKIYMWFHYLNTNGKAPEKSLISKILKQYNDYINGNNSEPNRSELHNFVSNA
ncbi:MAG: hypothetical protein ACFHU9_00675 [Fluviicola sp.]